MRIMIDIVSDQSASGVGCPPPELIMTEPDNIVDVDSDDDQKSERKDSLDVHEEGKSSYKRSYNCILCTKCINIRLELHI